MNTAMTRLMWKEYRAHRALWMVLLCGWFALHVAIKLAGGEPDVGFIAIPVCIFSIAAVSIAFAGECEDRTVWLLRMLPCSTTKLIWAKLMAIAVGAIGLILTMLVLYFAFELILLPLRSLWPHLPPSQKIYDQAILAPIAVSLFFCCSTVVLAVTLTLSLMTRKVIVAVGLSVFLNLVAITVLSPLLAIQYSRSSYALLLTPAIIACLLLAFSAVFLYRPWHLGHLPRTLNFWPAQRILSTTGVRPTGRGSLISRFWSGSLRRILARPFSSGRVTAILAWRELRSAFPFAMLWLFFGFVVLLREFFSHSLATSPWLIFFLLTFVNECGQRCLRDDQRTGAHLLLANMGASPFKIWWVKTACWGTVMVTVVGILIMLLEIDFRLSAIIDNIRVPSTQSPQFERAHIPATSGDQWLQIGCCLGIVLWTFAVGQLTACWIRRQILAFGAALILVPAGVIYLTTIFTRDWSVWLTMIPIGLCWLTGVALTSRRWMDQTASWRLNIQQAAWLIVPVLLFTSLGHAAWIYGPRWTQLGISQMFAPQTGLNFRPNTTGEFSFSPVHVLSDQWRGEDSPEATIWYEFARSVNQLQVNDEVHRPRQLSPPTPSWSQDSPRGLFPDSTKSVGEQQSDLRDILQPFDTYFEKYKAWPALPMLWTAPVVDNVAPAITACLLEDARYREKHGDIAGAIQRITQAIHANRRISMQVASWNFWLECYDGERTALTRLRLLLGTADLSGVDLTKLYEELKAELVIHEAEGKLVFRFPDPRPMLHHRSEFALTFGLTDVRQWEKFVAAVLEHPTIGTGDRSFLSRMDSLTYEINHLGVGGTQRAVAAMWSSFGLLYHQYERLNLGGRITFMPVDRPDAIPVERPETRTASVRQLDRVLATSSLLDTKTDLIVLREDANDSIMYFIQDTIAAERATLLTILLHKYRLANGKFPDDLLVLLDQSPANAAILTDPFTGSQFHYSATATPRLMRTTYERNPAVVAVAGPLLLSEGLNRFIHLTSDVTTKSGEETEILLLPLNLVMYFSLLDPVDSQLRAAAVKVTTISEFLRSAVPDGDAAGNEH